MSWFFTARWQKWFVGSIAMIWTTSIIDWLNLGNGFTISAGITAVLLMIVALFSSFIDNNERR
jgi:hypothetical protein